MSDLLVEIQAKAAQLSATERAELALRLIESLEPADATDWHSAWVKEADSRWDRFEKGLDPGIPADEVLTKARAALR